MSGNAFISCGIILVLFTGVRSQVCETIEDNCVPLCETECANGYCSPQNVCVCSEGYEKHYTRNTCVPKCDAGYIRKEETCVPHCSIPCGRCVAPERCRCDPGWELNEIEECVQINPDPIICIPPCGNGTCTRGHRCTCWHGFEFNETGNPRCVPSCLDCQGSCVAPGRCVCPEHLKFVYYTTADGRICDCSEDCDTKCYETVSCIHDKKLCQWN